MHVDEVAVVVADGDLVAVDLVVRRAPLPEHGLRPLHGGQGLEAPHGVLDAEGQALYGEGEVRAHLVDHLGLVDYDDELVGRGLDDLLPEEGTSPALHEVQVGVDGVSAVDGDVEARVRVEGHERDVQGLGLLLGADGRGDGQDVGELTGGELRGVGVKREEGLARGTRSEAQGSTVKLVSTAHPDLFPVYPKLQTPNSSTNTHLLPDTLHGEVSRGARAQPHDHPRLNVVVHGLVADHLLELVLAEPRGGHEASWGEEGGAR